ncbi:MAG: CysS/YqeB C-terminal domain-containing protein, partial [Candidatus Eiseniibacteriota bacterium]
NWKEADHLRDQLLDRGVVIEDGPSGPTLKRR